LIKNLLVLPVFSNEIVENILLMGFYKLSPLAKILLTFYHRVHRLSIQKLFIGETEKRRKQNKTKVSVKIISFISK
jgi:hypothetical protein